MKPTVFKNISLMSTEEKKCPTIHVINGIVPQSTDLQFDNVVCDCGKIIFYLEHCACPNTPQPYSLKSKPNPNA